MAALKKQTAVVEMETGAFTGENVGLFSSTCLGDEFAGEHVSLYSSTCISGAETDMHKGDATQMVSSTCQPASK
ncbi:DUF6749 family protein [Phaeobacter sp. HF9A]|uniref:DUF6749 family protein n=1 Tax=Phaeobacter sp. HF9A TaxID=2721561 RepID=UPI00143133D3|nr:DUF6749 family protein [Phaeobacter sp. HF9A]NIZ14379.1 hypothetical protein [Phaeobacter sp. HF9A]